MIFTACQLQEKCWEHKEPLHMTFIDLTKAFDTHSRSAGSVDYTVEVWLPV